MFKLGDLCNVILGNTLRVTPLISQSGLVRLSKFYLLIFAHNSVQNRLAQFLLESNIYYSGYF